MKTFKEYCSQQSDLKAVGRQKIKSKKIKKVVDKLVKM